MWESIKILKFERKRADLSNVEIYCKGGYQTKFWNLGVKGGKMLEFKWKVRNQSKCWNLGVKGRLIKLFKFECQMSNRSKCWNLSEKPEIDQMLIFYCKSGNRSTNLELERLEIKELIRMGQRWKLIKMLKFECKMSLQSKCWNLSEKGIQIDQNAEIWVKGGINEKFGIWRQSRELIKMLKIEC